MLIFGEFVIFDNKQHKYENIHFKNLLTHFLSENSMNRWNCLSKDFQTFASKGIYCDAQKVKWNQNINHGFKGIYLEIIDKVFFLSLFSQLSGWILWVYTAIIELLSESLKFYVSNKSQIKDEQKIYFNRLF